MKQTILKITICIMLLSHGNIITGQDNYYIQKINKSLSEKDCREAQKWYEAYKNTSNKTNSDIEKRIKACEQGEASTKKQASSSATPSTQNTFLHGVELIHVAGGTFIMGCTSEQGSDCYDEEKPAHQVTVNSFRMSKTEITNSQYAVFLNARGIGSGGTYNNNKLISISSSYLQLEYVDSKWRPKNGYGNYPVVCVTWNGAYEYCNWAGGRLPTEAEWEYAARGGNKSRGYKYSGSNMLDEVAWYSDNSGGRVHEVAAKKPNELGIYDMSGNVWEWCYDWYAGYESSAQNNPTGPSSGVGRVGRGGSWAAMPAIAGLLPAAPTHRALATPISAFASFLLSYFGILLVS